MRRYLAANHRFHFRLYGRQTASVLLPIVESLWMQVGPFLNGVFTQAGTRNARDNHTEVLKALRRRRPGVRGDAVAKDLADAADVILASVDFVVDENGARRPRASKAARQQSERR